MSSRRPPENLARAARDEGREFLLETEAYEALAELGLSVPRHVLLRGPDDAATLDLDAFDGERVVVKVVAAAIQHKSDAGGVAVVPRRREAIVAEVERMAAAFAKETVAGYTVNEFVEHDASLGGELLLGMRWTDDFGAVVTLGPGGIFTEFLAANLRPGRETAIVPAGAEPAAGLEASLERAAITRPVTGGLRGQPARLPMPELAALIRRAQRFAARHLPADFVECEINPLLLTGHGPVAVDALIRIAGEQPAPAPPRPLHKVRRLLEPESVAIVGVSERRNPGRIILDNLLREGFDPERIHVVKPGRERIAGCRCHADLDDLPGRVDLFILAIGAEQAPETVERIVRSRKAESVIVIPGGLGEHEGTEDLARRMERAIEDSRATDWQGPVINGGNCLGVRSRPGRYDTMFIPEYKLPPSGGEPAPLALISQSGALCVSRATKLGALNPRYLISLGNQIDLTVGDYLTYLADDASVEIFACYVEGFRPQDGLRWLDAAAKIVASGRTVIFYRAGRTTAGARASASHTASIAGDYAVARGLAESAGVVVAESLAEFDDLVRLFCMLRGKRVGGRGLGAMSNAGFECVAMADRLGAFRLPELTGPTRERLTELLRRCRLDRIVGVHNPLDVNPLMNDEAFAEAARAILEDDAVDVGIVGCVPMTGSLNTLAAGERHDEDVLIAGGVLDRLTRLKDDSDKAWVAVVDGGPLYDTLARELDARGVPTFRTADRAMRIFERFCAARLRTRRATGG